MTAVLNSKAVNVTLLDAVNPKSALTSGEGAPSRLNVVEDQITLPVTFFSATNNYARVARIPANAKIKRIALFTDAAVDSAATTGAAAFKVGVAFSDSTTDGTPAAYQGLVPSTLGLLAAAAGTVVALPSTANANAIFGTVTAPATTGAIPLTDVTFGGSTATYGSPLLRTQTPLSRQFNFLDAGGNAQDNLGYFDIFIMSSVAYTTVPSAVANLYVRVEYAAD